jgi:hypothetical protein
MSTEQPVDLNRAVAAAQSGACIVLNVGSDEEKALTILAIATMDPDALIEGCTAHFPPCGMLTPGSGKIEVRA